MKLNAKTPAWLWIFSFIMLIIGGGVMLTHCDCFSANQKSRDIHTVFNTNLNDKNGRSLSKGYRSLETNTNEKDDRGLMSLPVNKPLPDRIRHALTFGAKAKITLRIIDSKGFPVGDALIGGGFYNHGEKGHRFEKKTNTDGKVILEDNCVGDLNFGVIKDGYYDTRTTYWFFKNYFDCVKDGRWIPWNPTIEIVLKEKRAPKPLYTKEVESVFPKRESVGFDCLAADFVEPFGKGTIADFYLHYDSVVPLNGVTLLDWSYLTNNLTISSVGGGGFITKSKDIFSKMISEYEAPEKGYTDAVNYELKRTRDKIFMDRKLDNDKYLFFKSRVKRIGEAESANYGKIY